MNPELQYLKAIADSIKRLAGGRVGGAAAAAQASTNTITANANVDAPGVAETLDTGLLTTETQEEGGETVEVRVSAVKTLGDRVLEELEAAFFTGTGAQRTTFFSQIHDELVRIKDLNHLGDLDDVTLASEQANQVLGYTAGGWANITLGQAAFKNITTDASDIITSNGVLPTAGAVADKLAGYLPVTLTNPADKNVVMYDAPSGGTPAWKNVAPSSLLVPMMGGSQIGGLVGTDLKMMYWTGSQWNTLTLGKAAAANIASNASDIIHGNSDLPTASAVADKLDPSTLLPALMGSSQIGGVVGGDIRMPYWTGTQWSTIRLGDILNLDYSSASSHIYSGNNSEVPTCGAVYSFLHDHGLV